jgi:hypothetical protein
MRAIAASNSQRFDLRRIPNYLKVKTTAVRRQAGLIAP